MLQLHGNCIMYFLSQCINNHTDTLLNLDSLLIQLQVEVTPKWYEFGEAIGIEKKILDKYQQYSPEQSIIEILDNWLRNHAGQPTWREVAEAVRKVGLQKLAFDIERVYDTGKINLIRVCMHACSFSLTLSLPTFF